MSKLDELIQELCPDGVEYKRLGEIGKFYGGITGKSKEDFVDGNAKFITYKNIYDNLSLNLDVDDKVKINENENQRTLEYGDIIFTGSSETADECGISSVLTQKTDEKLYLNSFCFFLRLNDKDILNPDFAKHLFRSSNLRYQIGKTASGVTRFNVSKKAMERVCIPVPPLEVQCKIVRILDAFSLDSEELITELSKELEYRQKQYEYYRNDLIKETNKVEYKDLTLEDILKIKNGKDYKHLREGKYPVYGTGGIISYVNDFMYNKPSILIPRKGSLEKLYYVEEPFWNVDTIFYTEIDENEAIPKYIYYYLQNEHLEKLNIAGGIPSLTKSVLNKVKIILPSKKVQKRIVEVLDNFERICSNFNIVLPAEIEERQKQYEYYRNLLLTFPEQGERIFKQASKQASKHN